MYTYAIGFPWDETCILLMLCCPISIAKVHGYRYLNTWFIKYLLYYNYIVISLPSCLSIAFELALMHMMLAYFTVVSISNGLLWVSWTLILPENEDDDGIVDWCRRSNIELKKKEKKRNNNLWSDRVPAIQCLACIIKWQKKQLYNNACPCSTIKLLLMIHNLGLGLHFI